MIQSLPLPSCRVITRIADLENLRYEWKALMQESDANEPTLSPEWLLTWWRVFGSSPRRRLRFACFEEDGRLIGLAPLNSRWAWFHHGVPFRRLEPLASGEPTEDSICSEYLNLIVKRGAEEKVASALAKVLAAQEAGPWDELVFPYMDGTGPMPGLLQNACRKSGLLAEVTVTTHAPYIPLPASWDEYLEALSPSRRYRLRSTLREFDAWSGSSLRLEEVTSLSGLEKGRDILISLHKQRWNDPAEGGVFRSPRFIAFHDAIMPRLLEAGALQLTWLSAHDKPVAAIYNILWNNKIYFYQSGRDTSLPRHLRPGVVLIAKVLQQAIEAGRRELDFLGGDSTYKVQLALAARPLVELRIARTGVRESARRLLTAGAARYRRLIAE